MLPCFLPFLCIQLNIRVHVSDVCLMANYKQVNKNHLKNVGPIRHNEPPHAHSPDVAGGTVARRLLIDVHDNDDNDNDNNNA